MQVTLLAWALLTWPGIALAVSIDDDDEEELVKHAENLFKEEVYVEAFPLFLPTVECIP